MQAWRIHRHGEAGDVVVHEEVAAPTAADLAGMTMGLGGWEPLTPGKEPFDDWVLLDVSHAGLALPDITTARGTYPVPVPMPYIPGQEGVGTVRDAAPDHRHLIGKRVAAVCMQPWGSLAEQSVGISMIVEVPDAMSGADAAGLLIASHTGYHAAIRRGKVTAGETVVVVGAAGGVGSAMVQLCLAEGARVIGLVGGPEKVAFVESLGAEGVDHRSVDPVEGVLALTGGQQVHAILDPVQGDDAPALRAMLAPDGRHVLCGHAGGLPPHPADFYLRNHTLVGVTLGGYGRAEMRRIHEETNTAIQALLDAGTYRPITTRCVPFTDVSEALTDLAERRVMGRVVVELPAA